MTNAIVTRFDSKTSMISVRVAVGGVEYEKTVPAVKKRARWEAYQNGRCAVIRDAETVAWLEGLSR